MAEAPPVPAPPEPAPTPPAPPEPTPEPTPTANGEGDLPDAVKEILAKERKAAKEADKRAKAAEARAKEFEDKQKTEQEKLADRAQEAEQRAQTAESRLTRFEVAASKQVPADLIDFLTGESREELEQKADTLLARLKPTDATSFDSGARPPAPESKTPEQAHQEFISGLLGGRPQTQ